MKSNLVKEFLLRTEMTDKHSHVIQLAKIKLITKMRTNVRTVHISLLDIFARIIDAAKKTKIN